MIVSLTAVSGCGPKSPGTKQETQPASPGRVARTKVERGPVQITVEVAPEPVRLSDEPRLTLTIESEPGVEVRKPPFGDAVGDFIIRDFHEPLPESTGERQILRQVYTLEPTRAGPSQIDPITVTFVDKRPTGDGKEHQVETEAITVQVISVLDQQLPDLAQLEGLQGPVPIPSSGIGPLGWLLGGTLILGAGAGTWWFLRRRRARAVPPLSPREQATLELNRLWKSNVAKVEVKSFYVELTGIVRRYIEHTTGIHAPEQTTEEFLREVGAQAAFDNDERQRLKLFLESADLVKFAAYRPDFQDVEESYRRARLFVEHTVREEAV